MWLAAQRPGIAGVVLHSPLLSGVRVFNPSLRFWPSWLDIYPNHLLVRRVDAPLLVMHGTADEVRVVGRRRWQAGRGGRPAHVACVRGRVVRYTQRRGRGWGMALVLALPVAYRRCLLL